MAQPTETNGRRRTQGLLFVNNFERNVGYAWHTIGTVFDELTGAVRSSGISVYQCHRAGPVPAGRADETPSDDFTFNYSTTRRSPTALLAFLRLVRRRRITVLYLTDQPTWSPRYALFRLAGVRHILVHDRSSGTRRRRGPVITGMKRLLHRLPGMGADRIIGVSQFVVERLLTVNGTPRDRTVLVYNGIDVDRLASAVPADIRAPLGLRPDTPIVFCSGRAQPYKGIPVLIEAAAKLRDQGTTNVAFVYCGDGGALPQFRRLAARHGLSNFHFLGRRDDVPRLLRAATIAVVPSVWAEAFGLTVVEAMAAGVPVVASRTGGIPELVDDRRTGLLVEPGDADALAAALKLLLDDPTERERLARHAGDAVRHRFTVQRTVRELADLLQDALPAAS